MRVPDLLAPLVLSGTFLASAFKVAPVPREIYERSGFSPEQIAELLSSISTTTSIDASKHSASCPTLNATTKGVVNGPQFFSEEDILKRNSFVKRNGTNLTLLSHPFHPVGPNIYWLGLDENVVPPNASYPSKTRVLEAMGIVSAMRGNALRGHTLGISVGNKLSVEPELDVFNDDAYESIDFAVLAARVYGLKLFLPLTDNYNWYHGGKYQFIAWHGIPFSGTGADITPPDVGAFFYNTTEIVDSFKRYIEHHLNHVNKYTGLALKDDPTILGWESGNELSAARFGDGPAPREWTREIGEFVKGLAPNQLFADGTYGIYQGTDQLDNDVVDIFSDHFYPANQTKLETGISAVHAAGRFYLAGEYDWTGTDPTASPLPTFLSTISSSGGTGSFFWSLFGHDDNCCQYIEHADGFSFYYLRDFFGGTSNGNETDRELYKRQGRVLVEHAGEMSGRAAPDVPPRVACPQLDFGRVAQGLFSSG